VRACKLTVLLALVAAPASAQYSARQTQPRTPPSSNGKVLHFQKPADALAPAASPVDSWSMPDARPAPPAVVPASGLGQEKKPDDQKPDPQREKTPEEKEKEDRAKYVRPARLSDVFAFPDDAQLERVILDRLRAEEAKRIDPNTKMPVNPYNKYPKTLTFPPGPDVGGGIAYVAKTGTYPPMRVYYEPLYLVHRRLHFEEKNAERYGWDLGIIQPLVSAAYFYKDVLLWPNSLASGVAYGFWDSSAGKCLPGSPTPYMLYPPGLTITGTVFEGVIVTGVAFAIP
jgi:hypothetical protein